MNRSKFDGESLQAAAVGLAYLKQGVLALEQIVDEAIRGASTAKRRATTNARASRHHTMGESARKRIAAAQKKRWAQYRAEKAKDQSTGGAIHRKLTVQARAKMSAAAKRRWATAKAAKKPRTMAAHA